MIVGAERIEYGGHIGVIEAGLKTDFTEEAFRLTLGVGLANGKHLHGFATPRHRVLYFVNATPSSAHFLENRIVTDILAD
jgi:hypothetical protein